MYEDNKGVAVVHQQTDAMTHNGFQGSAMLPVKRETLKLPL